MTGTHLQVNAIGEKFLCAALFLTLLCFASPAQSQESGLPDDCIACHQDTYAKGMGNRHIHPPFLNRECEKCHGRHEVRRKAGSRSAGDAVVDGVTYEVDLADLRKGRALAIDSCSQGGCHSPGALGVSHPVGVAVRDVSPESVDLPLLEGGIVTCVTCHKTHSGESRYFAQADLSKKICLSCHTDYR